MKNVFLKKCQEFISKYEFIKKKWRKRGWGAKNILACGRKAANVYRSKARQHVAG